MFGDSTISGLALLKAQFKLSGVFDGRDHVRLGLVRSRGHPELPSGRDGDPRSNYLLLFPAAPFFRLLCQAHISLITSKDGQVTCSTYRRVRCLPLVVSSSLSGGAILPDEGGLRV